MADEAVSRRFEQIAEHYEARVDSLETSTFGAPPYKPLPPDRMFVDGQEWAELLGARDVGRFHPFEPPERGAARDFETTVGRSFAPERQAPDGDLFGAVVGYIKAQLAKPQTGSRGCMVGRFAGTTGKLAGRAWTEGRCAKLIVSPMPWLCRVSLVALSVLPLERGFNAPEICVIAEQDILGDRLVRCAKEGEESHRCHHRGDSHVGRRPGGSCRTRDWSV